ncbi:unnamed protein product [Clonostachys rosea f. rosea IK726]|uniref:Uncharacterized protein n=1 Tax=Clonostachys rosea f. rosea IK726 TaxID=1349383 RepID=A0ACA9U961_BIOOC|nr:unnamed protein product [Clonostachys rosea f. rosea IK726]
MSSDTLSHSSQDLSNSRPRPRSCILCHRRKIRCDKKEPCMHCVRADKQCVYPPSGPRVRRTKRTLMADMSSRIQSLEKTLTNARAAVQAGQHRGGSVPSPAETEEAHRSPASSIASLPIGPAASSRRAPAHRRRRSGEGEAIVVEKGSSSQYFNEFLISRVLEDEQEVRSVLTTPQSVSQKPPPLTPFNPLGILSAPSLSQPVSSFHPQKNVALRLWRLYGERVEDVTGHKVLHGPTDEVKVYTTIGDPSNAPFENLALCYAIYFTATVSLEKSESEQYLEDDRVTSLFNFKHGLEQAFAHGDFLDRPSITALFALSIYLCGLRVQHRGRSLWILNGLAIRIAQSLGLHRDGERLGLTPFQSEIRRRLWWHLLSRDGRAGEDHGLQVATSHTWDTLNVAMPLNVEDVDLYPEMTELPPPRKGWTPMTFGLIAIHISRATSRLDTIASESTSSSPPDENLRRQICQELSDHVEQHLELCNHAIPRQRMTLTMARFVVSKIEIMTRQQWTFLAARGGSREQFATEQNLIESLNIMDMKLSIKADEMLKPYWWSHPAFPQYHALLYALWHLCVKPDSPLAERAWKTIDKVFESDMGDDSIEGFKSKEAVLYALRAKARLLLEQSKDPAATTVPTMDQAGSEGVTAGPRGHAPLPAHPARVATTMTGGVENGAAAWAGYPMAGVPSNPIDLNIDSLDWEALVQGFQPQMPTICDLSW